MTGLGPSPIVCFLDESATDAKDSDHAVLAGTVMNRRDIPGFDAAWLAMLERHGATSGLHMNDLGPKGPYPKLVGDTCVGMLTDAVSVINKWRIFTFGASWDNRKHEELFSDAMRQEHFSVYAMTFMMAVEVNRGSAAHQGYDGEIDYVVDDGNRFKRHMTRMHRVIKQLPDLHSAGRGSNIRVISLVSIFVRLGVALRRR